MQRPSLDSGDTAQSQMEPQLLEPAPLTSLDIFAGKPSDIVVIPQKPKNYSKKRTRSLGLKSIYHLGLAVACATKRGHGIFTGEECVLPTYNCGTKLALQSKVRMGFAHGGSEAVFN